MPFSELSPADFERLCLRLARREAGIEFCRLYGLPGDDQEGIDLFARNVGSEKHRVYQCKRVRDFGPALIDKAIKEFTTAAWFKESEAFVLCTQESLQSQQRSDAIVRARAKLDNFGCTLVIWDSHELDQVLKDCPELVDDFFGRNWVEAFCGSDVAAKLRARGRMPIEAVRRFRLRLGQFYKIVFNQHDPGLPLMSLPQAEPVPLSTRYVTPDIIDERLLWEQPNIDGKEASTFSAPVVGQHSKGAGLDTVQPRQMVAAHPIASYSHRQPITDWLAAGNCSVVLGRAGSGKSTLLRYLAIDLLKNEPTLTRLADKWGEYLPVWVPFARWTRLIARDERCSLKQLLQDWLDDFDMKDELWQLVEQAVDDERLLLLVDGLDEWTDENAGKRAVSVLQVFLRDRAVPAVVTSRPHGYARLGMQLSGWQVGTLAALSEAQQRALALRWFGVWAEQVRGANGTIGANSSIATSRAEDFMAELAQSADLQELAKTPLLLSLLISLRMLQVASLPRNRFRAYEMLTELLISTHPERRRTAALVGNPDFPLTPDDITPVLAYLAYHTQRHSSEGLIEKQDAVDVLTRYLTDPDTFEFKPAKAAVVSARLLQIGAETLGILVEDASGAIGFFHRTLREYLAGYHLSRLEPDEQTTLVRERSKDPQWQDVILALCWQIKRPRELESLIRQIQQQPTTPLDESNRELLLAELAFGPFSIPASVAGLLALETFQSIERGMYLPHRARLLRLVIDGLRSSKTREPVEQRIKAWFPELQPWRRSIFRSMARWPNSPELAENLVHGLFDERSENQRAAALALAERFGGNREIGERLVVLATRAEDPMIRAAVIYALQKGWSDHPKIHSIAESARQSISPELQFVGIITRVQLGIHNDNDRDELLNLGSWDAKLNYHWKEDLVDTIKRGWPLSDPVKSACFEALKTRPGLDAVPSHEIAQEILISCYPQDDEVANYCAIQLDSVHPFLYSSGINYWVTLATNFKDKPVVVDAVDRFLSREGRGSIMPAEYLALVGRTESAKSFVLEKVQKPHAQHSARVLLEGWGMKVPDVAATLSELAMGPAARASEVGHLLPQIILDPRACRSRLLDLLSDPETAHPSWVLRGLKALNHSDDDPEAVDVVLNLRGVYDQSGRLDDDRGFRFEDSYSSLLTELVNSFPGNSKVRELALNHRAHIGSIRNAAAYHYGDTAEVRDAIICDLFPLPAPLRLVIAESLGNGILDAGFAIPQLELCRRDVDGEVRSAGCIGYCSLLHRTGEDTRAVVTDLVAELTASGFDHQQRSESAFCGLVRLNQAEQVLPLALRAGDDALPFSLGLGSLSLSANRTLIRCVLENWTYLNSVFGTDLPRQLARYTDEDTFWETMAPFCDDYPAAREAVLQFIESRSVRTAQPNTLRFIARVRPQSSLLLDYCLGTIRGAGIGSYGSMQDSLTAVELLGRHFSGSPKVLELLYGADSTSGDHGLDIALLAASLAAGWSGSPEFRETLERLRESTRPVPNPVLLVIGARAWSAKRLLEEVVSILERCSPGEAPWLQPGGVALADRISADGEFAELVSLHLMCGCTPSEKVTFAHALARGKGQDQRFRDWCNGEIMRQRGRDIPPEVGIDLLTGNLRPVAHVLIEITTG